MTEGDRFNGIIAAIGRELGIDPIEMISFHAENGVIKVKTIGPNFARHENYVTHVIRASLVGQGKQDGRP